MRVLMTTDAVGGVWTYSLALARGLCSEGWSVTLVVLGPSPDAAQKQDVAAIGGCTLTITDLPLDWTANDDVAVAQAGQTIAELAEECDANIIHLNSPALAADARFKQPVIGACHSCLASWWRTMRSGPLPPEFERHEALLRRGYAQCSALLAPSRSFAELTAEIYGIAAPTVVYNGWQAPPPSGIERQPNIIFTAGRLWDEAKGMAVLAKAAEQMWLPVHAAGPSRGPGGESIDLGEIRQLGVLGEASMAAWRERAGIFVSPSLYEPFGLAVLEAAMSGCALLLSDTPTFRELWDGAAVFTPAGDSDALADRLQAMAASPDLVSRMSHAAWERARRYSLTSMAAETARLYRTHLPMKIHRLAGALA